MHHNDDMRSSRASSRGSEVAETDLSDLFRFVVDLRGRLRSALILDGPEKGTHSS